MPDLPRPPTAFCVSDRSRSMARRTDVGGTCYGLSAGSASRTLGTKTRRVSVCDALPRGGAQRPHAHAQPGPQPQCPTSSATSPGVGRACAPSQATWTPHPCCPLSPLEPPRAPPAQQKEGRTPHGVVGRGRRGAACSRGPCRRSLTRAKRESLSHAGSHTACQPRLTAAHRTGPARGRSRCRDPGRHLGAHVRSRRAHTRSQTRLPEPRLSAPPAYGRRGQRQAGRLVARPSTVTLLVAGWVSQSL